MWWDESDPQHIGDTPWMHPAAVLYLESLLTPDMTVLEHGCGASTKWFAKRVEHVTAVDNDSDWIAGLALETKDFHNIRLIPLDSVIKTVDPVDLLMIDGYNHDRPAWMMEADRLVKPGGIIVLDNAERKHYDKGCLHLMEFCYKPTSIVTYTGYGKLVITNFYRVKGGEIKWI